MNRVEAQALSAALKIDKPFVYQSFWPLTFEKYITFHTSGKAPARNYLYFTEVIKLITPYLLKENIKVVQVGAQDDPAIHFRVFSLNGILTFSQSSYIINNSLLHFGCEGFLNHVAASLNIPLVALYSDTLSSESRPVWGSKTQSLHLDSPKKGGASYLKNEGNTQKINSILPETVARAILNSLNIAHDLDNYSTKFVGPMYHTPVFDVVPDTPSPNPNFLQGNSINVRADYHFNEKNIFSWINNRPNSILSLKSEIDLNFLKNLRQFISHVNVEVNLESDLNFLKELSALGLQVQFISKDSANLKKIRLKFIDLNIHDTTPRKPPASILENLKSLKIKSNKQIFSNGQTFQSRFHLKNNSQDLAPLLTQGQSTEVIPLKDTNILWEDLDHFLFYSDEKES